MTASYNLLQFYSIPSSRQKMQQTFQCSGVSLISCINTTFRYRYGRDSATPPVDGSEGNNTNYRNDVQLGDKDLIDIGEFFVFERPISILDNGHIIAEVKGRTFQ